MSRVLKYWRKHFLAVEADFSLGLGGIFTIWFYKYGGAEITRAVLQANRAAVYGTLASIFGSLLGFSITATSIVLSMSTSDKLSIVRNSEDYPKLWKTFISTIRALGFTTILSLTCLLIDKDNAPTSWPFIILIFSLIFSILRIMRTIWALESIIKLVTSPSNT